MLANPRRGDLVRLAYRRALQPIAPHQGAVGVVEIISRGKPRNHGVRLVCGRLLVVPCGHLIKLGPLAHRLDWREARS